MPPAVMVGTGLGSGSGQEGSRQSDWDSKVSGTTQACNALVQALVYFIKKSVKDEIFTESVNTILKTNEVGAWQAYVMINNTTQYCTDDERQKVQGTDSMLVFYTGLVQARLKGSLLQMHKHTSS